MPGRQLLDDVFVANELINYVVKESKPCLFFKVDFEKAYDIVSWNFLRYTMGRIGFGKL